MFLACNDVNRITRGNLFSNQTPPSNKLDAFDTFCNGPHKIAQGCILDAFEFWTQHSCLQKAVHDAQARRQAGIPVPAFIGLGIGKEVKNLADGQLPCPAHAARLSWAKQHGTHKKHCVTSRSIGLRSCKTCAGLQPALYIQ